LPFQSGSDRILAAMNRKHTAGDYLRLIERVREVRADIALSTDIIVGFPGEQEADFEDTLSLVRTAGFAHAYSFKYSPRPGTPAATMGEQVNERVKRERLERLQAVIDEGCARYNATAAGRTMPVLLEKAGRTAGQLVGRTPYLQLVTVEAGAQRVGEIVDVEIRTAGASCLSGVINGTL
jgi:tRNA-2-methylthio-N6-dimethylallyladenosine synthase